MKNTLSKKLLSIVLALMMIISIVPMHSFSAAAESVQPALWFMKDLQINQVPGGDYSHRGTLNFDVGGITSNDIFAPFDCKVVYILADWGAGNTVVIESTSKVKYADGTVDYMSMAFAHDNDISNLYVGKTIKQGEVFYQTGTYGNVTGRHSHVTCIKGKYKFDQWTVRWKYSDGTVTMGSPNSIRPENALFITSKTKRYQTQGLNFKTYSGDYSTKYTITANDATHITNTDATISFSVSPNATVSNWGFFLSTDRNAVEKGTSTVYPIKSSSTSYSVAASTGELQPGTKYYYKIFANIGGEGWASSVKEFRTTTDKPSETKLKVEEASAEIGVGVSPTVSWTVQKDDPNYSSRYFDIKLRDSDGNVVQQKTEIANKNKGQQFSFTFNPIMQAGTYSVQLEAVNTVGKTQATPVGTIIVHPDVTVTYVDADPQSFVDWQQGDGTEPQTYVRTCTWGKAPEAPNFPSHDGYTFAGWDKDVKSVTEDTTVTATYTRNSYTVNFVDEKGSVLDTQSVLYYDSAVAPSYQTNKTGYVFTNWDRDFSHVTGNMTVNAVIDWYNNNYSVYTTVTSATRDSDNSGYDISITVTNNANTFTMGRAVIALKTEEGKLLTSTESSAFAVKAGKTRDIDVFVPYDNAAKKVYVYIVNDYKTMTPISREASRDIDMGLEWTSWSTELPAEGTYTDLESRTEYRYKVKETKTSYSTSMSGWNQNGYSLVTTASGTIDYVSSWSKYFPKDAAMYSQYNKTPKTASDTSTQRTTVSTSTVGYIYWHWCRGDYTAGPIDRGIYYQKTSTFDTFHAFVNGSKLTSGKASDGSNYCSKPSVCRDTYWWQDDAEVSEVKRCTWTTYNKLYNYYRISDWSDWTTENVANPEAVDSRTVYRYKPVDTSGEENNEGVSRTVSGNLGSQYAGQELTLYIYKVDEASDYSNEYIGQTTLSNDGSYSFTFKLREEPTVKTGDYTVALGLEGASSLIYLDPIEAPRNEYTVVYRDWDGTLLSTQTVYEGDDAVLPAESLYDNREGYHFTHWTTTNTNVKDNLEIFAEYEINKYTVVFVDWEARSVQLREYEYGAPLTAPAFEDAEPGTQVVWDKIADGVTTVTQNMVVCTEYTPKVFDVVFRDFDGNIISQQNVTYGYAADVPAMDTDEDRIFLDWEFTDDNNEELESYIVTSKIDVCPRYVFAESCEPVDASVESGEYSETISVELTTPTENAVIYYTLDGSDPAGENGIKYTGPITIRDYAKLNCYCVSLGKNDSGISSYNYIVNTDMTVSDYMRAEELPDYVQQDPAYYNVQDYPAYEFKNTVTVDTQADYDAYTADGWQPIEEYTTTSFEPSMNGWTQDGYTLVEDSSGTFDYVTNWPSGFDKNNSYYTTYNRSAIVASETSTQLTTVSTSNATGWIFWHWCAGRTDGPTDNFIRDSYSENFNTFHAFYSKDKIAFDDEYGVYWLSDSTKCSGSYWWVNNPVQVNTCNWTTYNKLYNYRTHFTYTDWSDWQDEPITDDGTRMGFETETREYEYEFTTPSFKYSRWVYNDNGVTKYSNKEESGFTGTWEYSELPQSETQYRLTSMNPNTYTAPDGGVWYNKTADTISEMRTKTQYRSRYQTATLYKWDDTSFSMSIPQGETRESRPICVYTYTPVKHHFVTVVPSDMLLTHPLDCITIIADGEKLTEDIYPELYGYTPYKLYTDAECTDEWNLANDTVTEDVTLYAVYTPVKFNVTFAYEDGTVIETQSVDYLGSATAPESIELPDGYILLGWDSDAYESVTEDMVIHARAIREDEYATISISNDELSLLAGSRTTLTAETSVPGKDIIWTSSDDSIATVADGVVTAMSAGTVTITATVKDSGESDTCTVTVVGNPSIQLCLTTVSGLGYDSLGYIRGVKADGSTVDSVKPEFANPASKLRFYDIADAELASDALVGTGTTVKLVVEGEELDSKVFVVTGDMNGDGIINNRDVAMMVRYLVDKITPADYQILAVDVNGDGSVNNRDAAMLARYLVGKEKLA